MKLIWRSEPVDYSFLIDLMNFGFESMILLRSRNPNIGMGS